MGEQLRAPPSENGLQADGHSEQFYRREAEHWRCAATLSAPRA